MQLDLYLAVYVTHYVPSQSLFGWIGLTTNIWFLFVLTIIFTLGELVRSPVTNNFVSNYAPADARAQYMAASDLQFTIGRFLAPITVFISAWLPPIGVFSIILICAFISMVLYMKLFKKTILSVPVNEKL
jgi:dipeptide/tripeptide permease